MQHLGTAEHLQLGQQRDELLHPGRGTGRVDAVPVGHHLGRAGAEPVDQPTVGQFVQAFGYRTADRRGCSQLSISNSPLIPPSLSHIPLIETIYVRCDFELRSVANPRNARSEAPALDSLQVTDVHKMTHRPPDQYNDV